MDGKKRPCKGFKQNGFLLIQLAIFVVLFSGIMAYIGHRYWQNNIRTIADDRARLVGAVMASVDAAAKTYMTTYFTQIQRGQAVTMGTYTVPAGRVRAPTTADLRDLGMLAARSAGLIVYNGVELGFNVAITVDTSGGCLVPTCNLRSVVSSSVPMLDVRTGQPDIRRATIAAATASPGNAGVAMPASMDDGNPALFVNQEGNQVALNASGTAGVIGMANSYDSAGFMEFDRRDGSLPRTGSINMQDVMGVRHDINRAGAVGAQTVTADGRIKAGEYLELDNPAVKDGDPCAKDGLVARADKGLILSCQSGFWRSMGGGNRLVQGNESDYTGRRTINFRANGTSIEPCIAGDSNCSFYFKAAVGSINREHWVYPCSAISNTTISCQASGGSVLVTPAGVNQVIFYGGATYNVIVPWLN